MAQNSIKHHLNMVIKTLSPTEETLKKGKIICIPLSINIMENL